MYLKLNIHQAFYIECVYMNFFFIEFMQIINSEMYIESQRTGTKAWDSMLHIEIVCRYINTLLINKIIFLKNSNTEKEIFFQ